MSLISSEMFGPGIGAWIKAGCWCGQQTIVETPTLAEAERLVRAWRKKHPCNRGNPTYTDMSRSAPKAAGRPRPVPGSVKV